jgi:hypothetical protein
LREYASALMHFSGNADRGAWLRLVADGMDPLFNLEVNNVRPQAHMDYQSPCSCNLSALH